MGKEEPDRRIEGLKDAIAKAESQVELSQLQLNLAVLRELES